MNSPIYKLSPLLLALLAMIALPAFAGTPIDKTVAAKAGGDVHISNVAGSVKITTWNRNQVHVSGTLGTGAERLDVDSSDGNVDIRVVLPRESRHNVEGTDLVVQLPATSHLWADTVSANITASGLTAPVRLQSVSGDVDLTSKSPDIVAKSVSGNVHVRGSAQRAHIDAQSISGDVEISGVNGELEGKSVSGRVALTGSNTISRASINSTSGSIRFEAALDANGDYRFHTVSGDVTLDLPKLPAARFDVTTFSGDIDTNFGPQPQRKSEYGPGKQWNYQTGSGGVRVEIDTMSGDITLHAPKS